MKRASSVLLSSMLMCLAGVAAADEPAPAPAVPRVVVEISGLRSPKGVVRCNLFASPNGYPDKPERAIAGTKAPAITNGRAVCTFDNVKPGTYAIGFLHDENANGKMDTNVLGIPTEGYGASNNARGTLGPPKFKDAAFTHTTQTTLRLTTEY